jgi:alpha,alpha-trehalase
VSPSILAYIKQTWTTLTRTDANLAKAAVDPKFPVPSDRRWPVYVARDEDIQRVEERLRQAMSSSDLAKIDLQRLPDDPARVQAQGLLYLPKPWVVPGGRFNEMYGWDSFFIQMGLLRDGQIELAEDLADNCVYEIRKYGKILNANRTYYLTRSQPPFLTGMLLAVYRRKQDREWLATAIPAIEEYYRFWTTPPHLTPETGLSRYYDSGEGPAPEVVSSEFDGRGREEYDLIKVYYRTHRIVDYDAREYYNAATNQLTPLFYKGDRSMRESGFDPSNRFGPFSAGIIHYDPVCLNSLLYLMEIHIAEIMAIVGKGEEAGKWRERAEVRARTMNRLMWDEACGMYFDYNFERGRVRQYPFLTTFYPLWVGIASPAQAAAVARNLPLFECAGGLQTSTNHSGDQWDAPFGWAPLEWIGVEGLRRYGYQAEANRISMKFLKLVQREFQRHGAIVEKYDVVACRSNLRQSIRFGYHSNEAGFGWTNAVFTALFDKLPGRDEQKLIGTTPEPANNP